MKQWLERLVTGKTDLIWGVPRGGAKLAGTQLEFVCPFHRGDVLIGLHAACAAAARDVNVRMHVARALLPWVDAFEHEGVPVEPVNIPIPDAAHTQACLKKAMKSVARRGDYSGHIVCSHPMRALNELGIDLTEHMLIQLGLPPETKLHRLALRDCHDAKRAELLRKLQFPGGETVLLHPSGGWKLKSMSPAIVRDVTARCHAAGFRVVQIGGAGDAPAGEADGAILENLTPREWGVLFREARAVICVDSWTAHFAAMIDVDHVVIYGSTRDQEVGSWRHFAGNRGKHFVISSDCGDAPCNLLSCRYGGEYCKGMNAGDALEKLIRK